MTREEVIAVLRANEAPLRERGVLHAALFGSLARGEASADSDIDVLVDLDPEAKVSLFGLIGIQHFLGDLFLIKTDVVSRDGLKAPMRARVEADALAAF
ncbi:MAG: nucleotidyltransferase [Caulobacteraceae bacterium]|nr:nucleotidyltransferase [Caulobacteraceae bacterium]